MLEGFHLQLPPPPSYDMICRGIFAKSHVKDILGYCGAGISAYKKSLKIPKGQSESV